MSAARIKLITILCLCSTALSGPESGGVAWRDAGGSITIQCTDTATDHDSLSLERGLNYDQILYKDKAFDQNPTIAEGFTGRLQLHGVFPNLSIFIKNLTTDDTGVYWCNYKKYNIESSKMEKKKGEGSVLVVVTALKDQGHMEAVVNSVAENPKQCDPSDKNLVLLSVVISAAILLGIIIGFLIWIVLKTKAVRSARITAKPRRAAASNDVYEDMRGTRRH